MGLYYLSTGTKSISSLIVLCFTNFCPNKIITCRYKDAPWVTSEIKQKLKDLKTKIYKK